MQILRSSVYRPSRAANLGAVWLRALIVLCSLLRRQRAWEQSLALQIFKVRSLCCSKRLLRNKGHRGAHCREHTGVPAIFGSTKNFPNLRCSAGQETPLSSLTASSSICRQRACHRIDGDILSACHLQEPGLDDRCVQAGAESEERHALPCLPVPCQGLVQLRGW